MYLSRQDGNKTVIELGVYPTRFFDNIFIVLENGVT